jgi:hypothetical protein
VIRIERKAIPLAAVIPNKEKREKQLRELVVAPNKTRPQTEHNQLHH